MFIVFYVVLVVALIGIAIALGLRRAFFKLDETEQTLRGPDVRTASYLVPEGQDPGVLLVALHHAGYTAMSDDHGGHVHVVVECLDDTDRARVRRIIEDVHTTGFDGVPLSVGPVRFDDEV